MTSLRRAPLQGSCPLCSAPFFATLGDAIAERQVRCAAGHLIKLEDRNDSVRRSVSQVERDLANVQRTIRRIGRRR